VLFTILLMMMFAVIATANHRLHGHQPVQRADGLWAEGGSRRHQPHF
jgi:hypothetical protein